MSEHVPLERLILNLLALAEAAPRLPPDTLAELAGLADEVAPEVDTLARIGLEIQMALMGQAPFDEAKAAWDALRLERHSLDLDEVQRSLHSEGSPATGTSPLETLAAITREATKDPQAFADNAFILEQLAILIRQRWPRRSTPL